MIEKLPDQPGDVPLTYADISKARDLLNYRPHTQIAQGIPKFVDWFLESQKTR
jgi:UDP-glucuronate 4-epimerase